jgi:PAT family beta-lactamase induction signal transducer AmpG
MSKSKRVRPAVLWVPTSYFAEGVPFSMASWVAATMFKNLGHTDGEITVATAMIGFAWSLKPFWAAFLEAYKSKKFFVLAMEFALAALLAGIALALPIQNNFQIIIAILWAVAFASATQDICVDGIYITSLDKKGQAAWAGVQGVFWNAGRLFCTSFIVLVAGWASNHGYAMHTAWMYAVGVSAITMAALGVYHFFILPRGSIVKRDLLRAEAVDSPMPIRAGISIGIGALLTCIIVFGPSLMGKPPANATIGSIIGLGAAASIFIGWREHVPPFLDFFRKPAIWGMLLFVFLYRSGEGFLLQEAPLFLQSSVDQGGVGLTLTEKALIDGLVSTTVSLGAGLLGSAFAAKYGLKRVLVVLALCMNIPHLCYIYLSHAVTPGQHLSIWVVCILVSIEKFGYSFGFVGNMLYMMQQIAPGKYKMTHYSYATAIMNLVLIPTTAASGPIADWLGYKAFFIFVLIVSIPSVLIAWKAPFPDPKDVSDEDGDDVSPGAGAGVPLGLDEGPRAV